MSQLQIILGENGAKFVLWSVLGLAFILVAIIAILALRRLFGATFNMSGSPDRRNRPARLGVTDFFNLDRQGRRLVIVRRDNVEHLVLIGGPNDLLIERNIIRGVRPELPVMDTSTRPTVTSKLQDDLSIEAPSGAIATTRPNNSDRTSTEFNMDSASQTPQTAPVSSIVSRLNIPKLNVPNLDLRTSIPAQKTFSPKTEPVKSLQKMQDDTLREENVLENMPEKKPVLSVEPESLQKFDTDSLTQQFFAEQETSIKQEPSSTVQMHPPVPVLENSPKSEPKKQQISTAFGDATRRLEEALRRPVSSSSKPVELKSGAVTPEISRPIESAPEKLPELPAVSKPELEVETENAKPSLAADSLVLDLEQEMARLLGRIPNKNA